MRGLCTLTFFLVLKTMPSSIKLLDPSPVTSVHDIERTSVQFRDALGNRYGVVQNHPPPPNSRNAIDTQSTRLKYAQGLSEETEPRTEVEADAPQGDVEEMYQDKLRSFTYFKTKELVNQMLEQDQTGVGAVETIKDRREYTFEERHQNVNHVKNLPRLNEDAQNQEFTRLQMPTATQNKRRLRNRVNLKNASPEAPVRQRPNDRRIDHAPPEYTPIESRRAAVPEKAMPTNRSQVRHVYVPKRYMTPQLRERLDVLNAKGIERQRELRAPMQQSQVNQAQEEPFSTAPSGIEGWQTSSRTQFEVQAAAPRDNFGTSYFDEGQSIGEAQIKMLLEERQKESMDLEGPREPPAVQKMKHSFRALMNEPRTSTPMPTLKPIQEVLVAPPALSQAQVPTRDNMEPFVPLRETRATKKGTPDGTLRPSVSTRNETSEKRRMTQTESLHTPKASHPRMDTVFHPNAKTGKGSTAQFRNREVSLSKYHVRVPHGQLR